MGGHRVAMGGAALWYLFRSAVVAVLTLRIVPDIALFRIDIAWVGAPSLLLIVLFVGAAFIPGALRFYLPPIRIGALLAALTDLLAAASGSYATAADKFSASGGPNLIAIIVYGTLAVDLLIFAALLSYRPMDHDEPRPEQGEGPDYDSTNVEDE